MDVEKPTAAKDMVDRSFDPFSRAHCGTRDSQETYAISVALPIKSNGFHRRSIQRHGDGG